MPSFEGNLLTSGMKFAHTKLETPRYHMLKLGVSVSHGLESVRRRDRRTDERTDRENYDS